MSVTTTPPATVPPSNVVPFSLPMAGWSGGAPFPPGCCPPGGMDALMKCYCDVQQTLAFMSQIMQTLMTTDPNVQAAMVTGLEKTGSNLPLIGVTNGADAQPGQVGETVILGITFPYTSGTQTQNQVMGILQPGDWDIWAWADSEQAVTAVQFYLNPLPAGVQGGDVPGYFYSTSDANNALIVSPVNRALISVPTLFAFNMITISTAGGTMAMQFMARRRR